MNLKHYCNPVHYKDGENHVNPDPFVLRWCGKYYCYSTHEEGVQVSSSDNLIEWDYHGFALSEDGFIDFWAPSVIYDNGLFYLYYSNRSKDMEDAHFENMKVAVSESPIGPFRFVNKLFDKFSIDSHVIKYEGEWYLFYSTNDTAGTYSYRPGTSILVDKLITPFKTEGNPKIVVSPSIDEEIYERNRFKDGRDWHTIEGAFYFENNSTAYLMYSANAYTNVDYFVGYSVAKANGRPNTLDFIKFPDNDTFKPLIKRNDVAEGTGHNSLAFAPNMVDRYIVYHGRNLSDPIIPDTEQRTMRIDPLFFDDARLFTTAPTNELSTAPLMPTLVDPLNEKPKDFWAIKSGDFLAAKDGLYSTAESELLMVLRSFPDNYIAELSWQAVLSHFGACYGAMLCYSDSSNYLKAEFNSGKNTVELICCKGGIIKLLQQYKLSADYKHNVIHTIRIIKAVNHYSFFLDDELIIDSTVCLSHGVIGLFSKFTKVKFDAFAITEYLFLNAENLTDLSSLYSVTPFLEHSRHGLTAQKNVSLKRNNRGDFRERFTFELKNKNSCFDYAFCSNNGKPQFRIQIFDHNCMIFDSNGNTQGELFIADNAFTLEIKRIDNELEVMVGTSRCSSLPFRDAGFMTCINLKYITIKTFELLAIKQKNEV